MEVALSRAALGLIGFGVLCSAAELGARAIDPLARHEFEALVPAHLLRPDERLGWSPEPGAVGISEGTGRAVTYRINAAGLRDEAVPLDHEPGIFRIVLLGDGAAFGDGVAIEEHFSVGVERDLEQVEIVNLGVGGFSPDQMLLRLRSDGLAYDPDLVLAFVPDLSGEPDGLSPFAGRERPRFELAEGALVLADGPELGQGFLSALGSRLERWLARHSSAYHLLGDSLRGVRAADRIDPRLRSATRAPASPPSAERLALGEALVVAMRDEAAEIGAAFALVTQLDALHGAVRSRGVMSLDVGALLANPMFQLPGAPGRMDGRGNRALTHTLTAFLRESGLLAPQHWRTL
jgi:hypothetical protein